MKTTIQIEAHLCDFCRENQAYSFCERCGRDVCNECQQRGVAVHPFGDLNAEYCRECMAKNEMDGGGQVWKDRVQMAALCEESKRISERIDEISRRVDSVRRKQQERRYIGAVELVN